MSIPTITKIKSIPSKSRLAKILWNSEVFEIMISPKGGKQKRQRKLRITETLKLNYKTYQEWSLSRRQKGNHNRPSCCMKQGLGGKTGLDEQDGIGRNREDNHMREAPLTWNNRRVTFQNKTGGHEKKPQRVVTSWNYANRVVMTWTDP